MHRVGNFERVSFDQYHKAIQDTLGNLFSLSELQTQYEALQLPKRATAGSAGYDFHCPYPLTIASGEEVTIPTGIRVRITEGWFLAILPRSGLGFRYGIRLNNTMGIIDSDYYHADNEGHIFIKLTNGTNQTAPLTLAMQDRFAQGIFIPFGITEEDSAQQQRTGGMGSTGQAHPRKVEDNA